MNTCKKLLALPAVSTEWQQTEWCPDCEYYYRGTCGSLLGDAACPFDGKPLPLREVQGEADRARPLGPPGVAPANERHQPPAPESLEQILRRRIVKRTGGRVRALAVELTGRQVVIRGSAPCYHVKQLALEEVLDVLRSARDDEVELALRVEVCPGTSESGTWYESV